VGDGYHLYLIEGLAFFPWSQLRTGTPVTFYPGGLSNSLDTGSCIEALEEALFKRHAEIFNSDQGSQFTSDDFIAALRSRRIRISMDGRGRAMDNIMVERPWHSVKYEEVYLKDYKNPREAYRGLVAYFRFYNKERIHRSHDYKTPEMVYCQDQKQE
jgi:putative transposase